MTAPEVARRQRALASLYADFVAGSGLAANGIDLVDEAAFQSAAAALFPKDPDA